MLVVAMFVLASLLIVAGVALTLGVGPALVAAGVAVGLAARDLSTPTPGSSL